MKKRKHERVPMWWENREHGLEGREPGTDQIIAWIVPDPGPAQGWFARFVHHKQKLLGSPAIAREYAEKILGDQVTWWIFRLEDNKALKRAKA